ncbi:MAG: tRNA epoxyqueuosine(34) reductase QueG [Microthrixaceae bacterium]
MSDTDLAELADAALEVGRQAGLAAVGICDTAPFVEARRALEQRKAEGLAGTLEFTYRNPERSTEPDRLLRNASSLVVGAVAYAQTEPPLAGPAAESEPVARVARYATDDYYGRLRAALEAVAERLRRAGFRARVVADDNGLVDRAAARRAGLGWIGRNTGVISPDAGGEVVLGSVVTDACLPPRGAPVQDGCGSCRACEPACPTGALADGRLDARRCLAALVQAPGEFPLEFREALGDRLYGCDECTVVCPPSRLASRRLGAEPSGTRPGPLVDVLGLLSMGDDELMERFGRFYLPGRDPDALRRNALVVLGNVGSADDEATVATLRRYLASPSAMLAEHAEWAAHRAGVAVGADQGRGAAGLGSGTSDAGEVCTP